jgi:hypothetical protein
MDVSVLLSELCHVEMWMKCRRRQGRIFHITWGTVDCAARSEPAAAVGDLTKPSVALVAIRGVRIKSRCPLFLLANRIVAETPGQLHIKFPFPPSLTPRPARHATTVAAVTADSRPSENSVKDLHNRQGRA